MYDLKMHTPPRLTTLPNGSWHAKRFANVVALLALTAGWLPLAMTPVEANEEAPPVKAAPSKASPPKARLRKALSVPQGIPIQLDGHIAKAAWEDALHVSHPDDVGSLAIKRQAGALCMALQFDRPWRPGTHLVVHIASDEREGGAMAPGALELNYEPYEHDRSHVILSRYGEPGVERLMNKIVVRKKTYDFAASCELAIPYDVLAPTLGKSKTIRVAVLWAQGRGHVHSWPHALDMRPKRPPNLPHGLASTSTWLRLTGFEAPPRAGALPTPNWKALIAADQEISDRGSRAHVARNLVAEEWRVAAKEDKVVTSEIFDNFQWISKREALTHKDVLALAQSHHWLNQHGTALALYDSLARGKDRAAASKAGFERARVLESMGRYEDAANAWEAVGARPGLPATSRAHYVARAKRARTLSKGYVAELAARAKLDGRTDLPLVEIVTPHGVIVLQLYRDDVPKAVKHFLDLVRAKFYDGTLFHRVIGDAFAHGGDPTSREHGCDYAGSGTSPKEIDREVNAKHGFWRGGVGFASGVREKNGSQFFIMVAQQPRLGERGFTCFGRVYSGQSVVDRIERCDPMVRVRILQE